MVDKKKAVCVDFNDSISKAQAKIKKTKEALVVLKDEKYYGILDARQIKEHPVQDPSNTHCGKIAFKAPRLYENEELLEITKAFFSVRFSDLAVVTKKEKVIGAITRFDVLKEILKEKIIPKKRVGELMSFPLISIGEHTTISEATTKMRLHGVRRLAVLTKTGNLKGLLSTFDIGLYLIKPIERLPKLTSEKANYWEQPIGPLIKIKTEIISPKRTLTEAVKKMTNKKVASLIVCENKKPIGIISTKDIFEAVLKLKKKEIKIHVSGLDRYDKAFYQDILNEGEKTLTKLLKYNKQVGGISLHIKKYGNRYTVMARLEAGNKVIKATGNEWNLPSAVNEALENLKRMVRKHGLRHIAH